eukprot:TRINITY_DN8632_c0_g2_i1.p1 TRINITY_DN8632_c0_g2~~TRINITY_DN8632_c0_g2_i1.p1  ORF type:complete len:296 (-),score=48.83 TRINITY_DN8632_c0_g2_i1:77-964(-)
MQAATIDIQGDVIGAINSSYPDKFQGSGGVTITYKESKYILPPKLLNSENGNAFIQKLNSSGKSLDEYLSGDKDVNLDAFDAFMKLLFARKISIQKTHFVDFVQLTKIFGTDTSSLTYSENEEIKVDFEKIFQESEPTDINFLKVIGFTYSTYPSVFTHLLETHYLQILSLIESAEKEKLRLFLIREAFLVLIEKVIEDVKAKKQTFKRLVDLSLKYFNQKDENDAQAIDKLFSQFDISGELSSEDINQLLKIDTPYINNKKVSLLSRVVALQSEMIQRLVGELKSNGHISQAFE